MIYKGNSKIGQVYRGSMKFKEIYKGSELVLSGAKPSYLIKTDGTRVDFELENTPINNLTRAAASLPINGSSVAKTTIKELVFGDSYSGVTNINSKFLWACSNLTSLDLSAFSNVTNISNNFLWACSNLTSLDLSAFSNVTNIGSYFLANCSNLTQFKIGAINVPPTSVLEFLTNSNKIATILVPMQSVQAYKTTAPWSNHANKITGY